MNEVLLIGGMAAATFAIRYVIFGVSHRVVLSEAWLSALRYVPPVVLTAIVVPEILLQDSALQVSYLNARLIGAIAAIVVSVSSRNLLLTIVVGMLSFWGWQRLVS